LYARVSTKEQAERNGDPEGYSIPAQREACQRKAESLGATVTDEFVDRGESTRSADRTELQRMLKFLKRESVDVVAAAHIRALIFNTGTCPASTRRPA
jgi:site-specific DNA recombinase